jgi:hypothetical protein
MTTQTNSLDISGWRNLCPQLEGQREQQIRECTCFKALKGVSEQTTSWTIGSLRK